MVLGVDYGTISGGGGQSDSGSIVLTASTDEFIPLSFEPKVIYCKFSYNTSDYVVVSYAADYTSSKQYSVVYPSGGAIYDVPNTGMGNGGLIQSVANNGFTVKANGSYKNLEWWAYS